jgi:hypothetical protein
MKKYSIIFVIILFYGCHDAYTVRYEKQMYGETDKVLVYSNPKNLPPYTEIGYVEAKGGILVPKQYLLDDMIAEAKVNGADALINVEFYDRTTFFWDWLFFFQIEKPAAKAMMIRFNHD